MNERSFTTQQHRLKLHQPTFSCAVKTIFFNVCQLYRITIGFRFPSNYSLPAKHQHRHGIKHKTHLHHQSEAVDANDSKVKRNLSTRLRIIILINSGFRAATQLTQFSLSIFSLSIKFKLLTRFDGEAAADAFYFSMCVVCLFIKHSEQFFCFQNGNCFLCSSFCFSTHVRKNLLFSCTVTLENTF